MEGGKGTHGGVGGGSANDCKQDCERCSSSDVPGDAGTRRRCGYNKVLEVTCWDEASDAPTSGDVSSRETTGRNEASGMEMLYNASEAVRLDEAWPGEASEATIPDEVSEAARPDESSTVTRPDKTYEAAMQDKA